MHEILRSLPPGAFVLDLGCAGGSFTENATRAVAIRIDLDRPRTQPGRFVQCDASKLCFADGTFQAVVSNHSLEHIENLEGALQEIRRILRPEGALFIAVPDASTVTDKVYRWLARGGGHVNAFTSPAALVAKIETFTGLRHVATRTLGSSLSFLNRRIAPLPRPRRLLLLGGGFEWTLRAYVYLSRRLDRWLGTRTGVYGWAFYFGNIPEP